MNNKSLQYILPAVVAIIFFYHTTPTAIAAFGFIYGQQTFSVPDDTITSWQGSTTLLPNKALVTPPPSVQDSLLAAIGQPAITEQQTKFYNYNLSSIYDYISQLSKNVNQSKIDAVLDIENGKVKNFTLPQSGIELDVFQSTITALNALQNNQATSSLVMYQTDPAKTLAQTNNLGINELIGEGVSKFNGSPHNRRVNIAVGLSKFQGLIIPSGATFSFDDNLGPVTADAGFLPELVIDNGNTLPELGGGLCQVSTTTFRAAMQAGLPILDRRNHAYAVSYYSPQGTDATIYPGSADLKFKNDTPGSIMIWPYEKDANTLVFDFYGTSDNRQVTLEKPVIYDRTSDGAMKATWTRIVTAADGTSRTDVFKSTYQPPALFHKTETYVSATGTQSSTLH